MGLLEQNAPRDATLRSTMAAADRRATVLGGLGWILTLGAILGLPGPDGWFMALAPTIGTVTAGPALLAVFLQRYRGGFARGLLIVGAAALAIAGAFYLHSASMPRVLIAYFAAAAFLVAAASVLQAAKRA